LSGRVRDPHTAGEDLPENHLSYDFDFNVSPDPGYRGLAGGSPSANGGKGSGNWDRSVPEEYGTLHVEWESAVVPTYAWPDEGDRVRTWGQWIWDCGHWGEGFDFSAPGASDPTAPLTHNGDYLLPGESEELGGIPDSQNIRGEQTELHPLEGMVVTRATPYAAVSHESETDAYFSTAGAGAHAVEKCAHDVKPPAGQPGEGPQYTACVHDTSNEYQSLSGKTFSFVVPAPPKPSPGARLRYREQEQAANHHAHDEVTPAADGLHVRVTFDRVSKGELEQFGKSWFVGWEGDRSASPTHLRWTLRSITVNDSLDPNPDRPQQSGVPPGEYNLYVDLNGYWNFVGGRGPTGAVAGGQPPQWVAGLGAVHDGQTFSGIDRSIDFFVPPGKPVRLLVDARECDLPHMDPCALTTEVSDGNDSPGDHRDEFASVDASLGTHVLKPKGDAYEMTYSIARIKGVGQGPTPPGSPGTPGGKPTPHPPVKCADVHAPRSHFARRGAVRLTDHGLALHGRARDRGCGGLRRVAIAVARHLGHRRCQYMRANGSLRRAGPCSAPSWIAAHGRVTWRLMTHRALRHGTYTAHVRAVDRTGNVELFTRRHGKWRNFLKFRVR
ncbi:MAG: hypothetical protein QOG86_1769, partial [Thermoleophilaceae bacterium]|nr:hypothetical protein [Thermoleophilaceae bacterium]